MAEWDTTQLLSDIKERGSLPDNDARFTDALLLRAATLELREGVAPLLSNARAEYLVYTYPVAVVSGTAAYRMPPRAIGGALRNVSFNDSAGNPHRLRELSSDEVETIGAITDGGTPYGYYLRNYHVVLVPVPNVSGTLEMPYYARPNKLVLVAEDPATEGAGVVVGVSYNTVADTLTLFAENVPTNLQPADTAMPLDIVRATPGFETLVSAAETQVSVSEPSPGTWQYVISSITENPNVAVGDYICESGQAPVPQVPVELHGLLAVRAARRAVKSVGDDRWQALDADVAELEEKAKDWLKPRVSGQTQQAGGSIGISGLGPFGGGFWSW
jgi:hypothetical protein